MRLTKYLLVSTFLTACIACSAHLPESNNSRQGPSHPTQAVQATVCEVVKNGAAFDGKYISVRAFVVGGVGHGMVLVSDDCAGSLTLDGPESVREHPDYLAFMRTILENGGGFTRNSKSRVTARFDGSLEYHPKDHRKWVLKADRIFEIEVKRNARKPSGR